MFNFRQFLAFFTVLIRVNGLVLFILDLSYNMNTITLLVLSFNLIKNIIDFNNNKTLKYFNKIYSHIKNILIAI